MLAACILSRDVYQFGKESSSREKWAAKKTKKRQYTKTLNHIATNTTIQSFKQAEIYRTVSFLTPKTYIQNF